MSGEQTSEQERAEAVIKRRTVFALVTAMAESSDDQTILPETIPLELMSELRAEVLANSKNATLVERLRLQKELEKTQEAKRLGKTAIGDVYLSSELAIQVVDDVLENSENTALVQRLLEKLRKARDLIKLKIEPVIRGDALAKLVETYNELKAAQSLLKSDIETLEKLERRKEQLEFLDITTSEERTFVAELGAAIAAMQAEEKTPIPEELGALVARINELLDEDEEQTLHTSPREYMSKEERSEFLTDRRALAAKLFPGQTEALRTIKLAETDLVTSVFDPPQAETLQEFIKMEESCLETGAQVKTARQVQEPDPGVLDVTGMFEVNEGAGLRYEPETQKKDKILGGAGKGIQRDLEQFRDRKFEIFNRLERLTVFLKLLTRSAELIEERNELLKTHGLTDKDQLRRKLEGDYAEVYGLYQSAKTEIEKVASHVYEPGAEGI